jgi:hypothetical protein
MKAQAASGSTLSGAAAAAAPKQDFGNVKAYGKKSKGATKSSGGELEGFMGMLGQGKGKGRKSKKAPAAAGVLTSQPVRLDMSMLSQLGKYSTPVPRNTEDVPASIKVLAEKRVEYLNKPAKKSPKKAAPAAAPAAALAAAPVAKAAAVATSISVGDSVTTPYGGGSVQEVRADGMAVVDIEGYSAVAYMMEGELVSA